MTTAATAEFKKLRWARALVARRDSASFAALCGKDEQSGEPFKLAESHVRFHQLAAQHPRLTFLAHFGWGKTAHSVLLAAHRIGRNPATRILLVCASHGEAMKRGRLLLSYLKSPGYRTVFPKVQIERESDSQIIVKRSTLSKDPTFQSVGIGSEFLGSRVDFAILDDVSTLEDSQSESVRTTKVEIVRSMLLPRLAPGGAALTIATPWAVGDVSDVLAHTPGWHVARVPVIDQATGKPSWPEKFPLERIQALRAELGPFASARALDLYTIDDSTARFKRAWIDSAIERGKQFTPAHHWIAAQPNWATYVGVDLGVSTRAGSDLTSFATIAVAPNEDRRLLSVESGRWTADTIIAKILEHNRRYQPSSIIVESVAAQAFIIQLVQRMSAAPITGFVTGAGRMSLPFQAELLGAEMSNNKWIVPSSGGTLDPEIDALTRDLLHYSPTEHTGDRLASLLFARWGAARGSRRVEFGRIEGLFQR